MSYRFGHFLSAIVFGVAFYFNWYKSCLGMKKNVGTHGSSEKTLLIPIYMYEYSSSIHPKPPAKIFISKTFLDISKTHSDETETNKQNTFFSTVSALVPM